MDFFSNNQKAIINPQKIKNFLDVNIGTCAVMVSTDIDFRYIKKNLEQSLKYGKNFKNSTLISFSMSKIFTFSNKNNNVVFVGPYIGAPYGVMLLESLIATGIKKIIILGWCGAISDKVKIGDIIIPKAAISQEGTSGNYINFKQDFPCINACKNFTRDLSLEFEKNKIKFQKNKIWTTDAIYRETQEKVEFFKNKGAIGVDMECSALFAVAKYQRKNIAAVLIVSDELSSLKWKTGFKNKKFINARKKAANIVMDFALKNS
ncbi:MAG: hypothetical protein B6I26_08325 [Desulfobacteraceae bacterium 4572_130]|nr:MAG: hypothetical protein B6I26_08325 [Desulfobacteraceae bacterium 4572_130]